MKSFNRQRLHAALDLVLDRHDLIQDFKESEHRRGTRGTSKGGQFVAQGGGGSATSKPSKSPSKKPPGKAGKSAVGAEGYSPADMEAAKNPKRGPFSAKALALNAQKTPFGAVTLKPAKPGERAWSGSRKPMDLENSFEKLQTGAIGERAVLTWLKSQGSKRARFENTHVNNYPIDIADPDKLSAIEVKSGYAGNVSTAMHWRVTIGKPSPAEEAWLKTASPADKAKHNAAKMVECMKRKAEAAQILARELKKPVKSYTHTNIVNPDTGLIDMYRFDGFHPSINWHDFRAPKAYLGTFHYQSNDPRDEAEPKGVKAARRARNKALKAEKGKAKVGRAADAETPKSPAPPEVWAAFERELDVYITRWTELMRKAFSEKPKPGPKK